MAALNEARAEVPLAGECARAISRPAAYAVSASAQSFSVSAQSPSSLDCAMLRAGTAATYRLTAPCTCAGSFALMTATAGNGPLAGQNACCEGVGSTGL